MEVQATILGYGGSENRGWGNLIGLAFAIGLTYALIQLHRRWRAYANKPVGALWESRGGWFSKKKAAPGPPVAPEDTPVAPLSPPETAGQGAGDQGGFALAAHTQVPRVQAVLEANKVQTNVTGVVTGPRATRIEIEVPAHVRVPAIVKLLPDLQVALRTSQVRLQVPIPGKSAIGVEVPNDAQTIIGWDRVEDSLTEPLSLPMGADFNWTMHAPDLATMPHLLVGGSTGTGKSTFLRAVIRSVVRNDPAVVQLILIDPKRVEFTPYRTLAHLATPVVTDISEAASTLGGCTADMDDRYARMAEAGVSHIKEYNRLVGVTPMPLRVVIIDELADLMMVAKAEVESSIVRIGQLGRAAGYHLVLATQRPEVAVVTGLIKANIPARLAFLVSSMTDSRVILDQNGAEALLGEGDALWLPAGSSVPIRVQTPWVDATIATQIGNTNLAAMLAPHIAKQAAATTSPSVTGDTSLKLETAKPVRKPNKDLEALLEATRHVLDAGYASTSMLQRRMKMGYERASRLIDTLESLEIIGPNPGAGASREVHYALEHLDVALARVEKESAFL